MRSGVRGILEPADKQIRPGIFPWPDRANNYNLWTQRGKWNVSNRSLIAGPLTGTYGLLDFVTGFGKLSRLRKLTVPMFQFLSMNLRMETWSEYPWAMWPPLEY